MPITPAITGPMAMPMRTLQIDAMRGGQPLDQFGQPERHAGEARQMIVSRQADAGTAI